MKKLIEGVGIVWAVIGAGNIVLMPWGHDHVGMLVLGLVFNMFLFVMPGLALYGVGNKLA